MGVIRPSLVSAVTQNRMVMSPAAEFIDHTLQVEGSGARAASDADRIGGGLGFYGASIGAVRGTVRDAQRRYPGMTHDEVTTLASELWSEPVYERRLAAIVLLQRHVTMLRGNDLTRVEQFLRDARVPELVDPLAADVVRPLLVRLEGDEATRGRRIIDRWAAEADPNLRRAASFL
ncbi:DNA alkylation repair protein [Agromyces sp. Soil535]|uniref:DNA alkylation repair protein n=1 Tax=Agromyces sp. Soil535 TaxID=1736390 RepID=UPI000B1B0EF3|nr:DNA alkylation repair protein [Agromyces sp. Soil535]